MGGRKVGGMTQRAEELSVGGVSELKARQHNEVADITNNKKQQRSSKLCLIGQAGVRLINEIKLCDRFLPMLFV